MFFLSTKEPLMAILGISTNTRLLGTAIIEKGVLAEYSIRLFKTSWSPAKATRIITSLEPCVRQYSIKTAVLSIPPLYHRTEAFNVLLLRLSKYFERKQIPVVFVSPEQLLSLCATHEKQRKKTLMDTLCKRYPELVYCQKKEVCNKSKYYIKLFEAVAAATLHQEE